MVHFELHNGMEKDAFLSFRHEHRTKKNSQPRNTTKNMITTFISLLILSSMESSKPHRRAILNLFNRQSVPTLHLNKSTLNFYGHRSTLDINFTFRFFSLSTLIVQFKIVIERCFPTDVNFEAVCVVFNFSLGPSWANFICI